MCGAEIKPLSPALRQLADRAPAAFDPAVAPVPSPCISVCRMDADRVLCTGCWRTLDEIRAWSGADAHTRRAIWLRLLERARLAVP